MTEKKMTLDDIHAELLEQLRDIVDICNKHNIQYNLMCGTLLGAVRHHGFIPWDDDVDLLMTREEFNKFREVYPKECDKRFSLTYLDTWTPRVMNSDPAKAEAFTDFFILDRVPKAGIRRKLWFLHLHLLQGMMKKKVDYSRFNLKNRILLRVTHWMGLPFSYAWKAKRYEKVSTRVKEGNDLCMSNGAFELMMHIWHPEQFAEKITADFDGIPCLIPAKYDEVLTILFGPDYMTPPPENERVAKHLDL
ncbi:MAG: LicD family protein [Clostridia bacterium]|nr:LicD family protein [Clostridia bacterium]